MKIAPQEEVECPICNEALIKTRYINYISDGAIRVFYEHDDNDCGMLAFATYNYDCHPVITCKGSNDIILKQHSFIKSNEIECPICNNGVYTDEDVKGKDTLEYYISPDEIMTYMHCSNPNCDAVLTNTFIFDGTLNFGSY